MLTETAAKPIEFDTHPDVYKHWKLTIEPPIATLSLDVQENEGLHDGYVLKLNSYDLGVDIELADAVQRLRFEHPEVKAVVITGGKEKVFCAGANIGMLAQATHAHKVNFCKYTNETRLAMEDALESGQVYICALNGTASGGGYELALACNHIILVDDGSSAVSLPELPLLGVLPGTGGLTRMVDKRGVRRDVADLFATKAEGVKGPAAVKQKLVDEVVPRSSFAEAVQKKAEYFAETWSRRPSDVEGIKLNPVRGDFVKAEIDRTAGLVNITVHGPQAAPTAITDDSFWSLATARELDDLIVRLRFNEPEIGTFVIRTSGDPELVAAYDKFLLDGMDPLNPDWLVKEVVLMWKRTLKRLDVTSRSIIALIEPGSCFAGTLFELALVADRSYMLDEEGVTVRLTEMNRQHLWMGNGQCRLATRFGEMPRVPFDETIDAQRAAELGLVTVAADDLDYEDEVRLALEERAAFSPDALTGLEQNFRFAGPETMETKIFGRLSCWQNWIFSRPNATGPEGALPRYGTGLRPTYDRRRV